MTASAVNSSPSDRPPPSLISPSPWTAWVSMFSMTAFALLRLKFTEGNSGELVGMMKSAAETVAGAASLKAAKVALAPFAELYAQISSIQGHDETPAPHTPTQISPETRNLPILHPSISSPRRIDTRKCPLPHIRRNCRTWLCKQSGKPPRLPSTAPRSRKPSSSGTLQCS